MRNISRGIPNSTYQSRRAWHQYSYHFGPSAGGTKNSISICSNSRVRKMKFPGVISLRKLFPTCAMPNGGRLRLVCKTFAKFTNIPCAVSGRMYTSAPEPSTGPAVVLNIRLKARDSVNSQPFLPCGQSRSSMWSSRKRRLQTVQSTSGSEKFAR